MTSTELKKFKEDYPEVVDYVNAELQKAVKLICDIMVSQYDQVISANQIAIEKLKSDVKNLEIENWNSNTL